MSFLKNWWSNWKYYKTVTKSYKWLDITKGYLPSETYGKYPPTETFVGKRVLNVGCGKCTYHTKNVVNLDTCPGNGVNVVWDLSKTPLPFDDNSFDLIIANHVLEHVPGWFECLQDLARIVKVGGTIEVWIPPLSSDTAFTYRDHINIIGDASFHGCRSVGRSGTNLAAKAEINRLSSSPFSKLEIVEKRVKMAVRWWITLAPQSLQNWMVDYLRNIVSEVGYIFKKGE